MDELPLQIKLIPPRRQQHWLQRPRVLSILQKSFEHPLTLVIASAGYGKSTALTAFANEQPLAFWLTLDEADVDPLRFMLHLVHTFRLHWPACSEHALALLRGEDSASRLMMAMDSLVNDVQSRLGADTPLILDDFDRLANEPQILSALEHFIEYIPSRLHLILSARERPRLNHLARWRARGDVLEIGQDVLAFTLAETLEWAGQQQLALSAAQVQAVNDQTEGWPIALRMRFAELKALPARERVTNFHVTPSQPDLLFEYLAQDVCARLDASTRDFLMCTSILSHLTAPTCDYLLARADSAAVLERLAGSGLFITDLGGGNYRYHRLFQEFWQRELRPDENRRNSLHARAVAYYEQAGDREQAVSHALAMKDDTRVVGLLTTSLPAAPTGSARNLDAEPVAGSSTLLDQLLFAGRFTTVAAWLDGLSHSTLAAQPALLMARGDAFRFAAQFDDALRMYQQAEHVFAHLTGQARALRGQALIYLDTVRPALAETFLERALTLLPKAETGERAALLRLLAENKTNRGQTAHAAHLYKEADTLEMSAAQLDARMLLRTGRLREARTLLTHEARIEASLVQRPPKAHREPLLLLALIEAFMGEGETARQHAERGLQLGKELGAPFVETVAWARQGHAWLCGDDADHVQAERCYALALARADTMRLDRPKAEIHMGLALLRGLAGRADLVEAEARTGLEIVARAGDDWMAALLYLSGGAAFALADNAQAEIWLSDALRLFGQSHDTFGETAAHFIWALRAQRSANRAVFAEHAGFALQGTAKHGYDFLFTRRTFFWPTHRHASLSLLLLALKQRVCTEVVEALLAQRGIESDQQIGEPSTYPLRVQAFGPFAVWRGDQPIAAHDWQRNSARKLFQFLLTSRSEQRTWVNREHIKEALWPALSETASESQFKVALSSLVRVLEPQRSHWGKPFFVLRRDTSYALNPLAEIESDTTAFERGLEQGERHEAAGDVRAVEAYRQALAIYQDVYLPECLYDDWASAARERWAAAFLRAGTRLAALLFQLGADDECLAVCERLLQADACWEEAYRLQMQAHARLGQRPQALRVYETCVRRLRADLDVGPSPATRRVYQSLRED